ncbi:SCO1664 family protein [Nocardioides korecus]
MAPDPGVLLDGELTVVGRIMPASNQTFLTELGPLGLRCVYKPRSGERPLWDFADGTLASREYAAWVVSDHLGWDVVPPTVLRDGPVGPGMVQLWMDTEEDVDAVDVIAEGPLPEGYLHVLDATGARDEPVMLVHEDSAPLRRMAVFDVITNNTDRKGGHVLPIAGGHRHGVDHGVCFHVDDKLRTVLWGWAGYALSEEERAGVESVLDGLTGPDAQLRDRLEDLLAVAEVDAVARRCQRLLRAGGFPVPEGGWPAIPWPPF